MSKYSLVFGVLVVLSACDWPSHDGAEGHRAGTDEADDASDEDNLEEFLDGFVQAKYEALLTGEVEDYLRYFDLEALPLPDSRLVDEDPSQIPETVAFLRQTGVDALDIEGGIEIVDVVRSGDRWTVRYVETSSRTNEINGVAEGEATTRVTHRTVVLAERAGKLTIIALTVDPSARDTTDELTLAAAPVDEAARPATREGTNPLPLVADSGSPTAACGYYKPFTAAVYADTYCGNPEGTLYDKCGNNGKYNGAYANWGSNDCANFVSQALVKGGRSASTSWYYGGKSNTTTSWINVDALYAELKKDSVNIISVSDIKVGDILFLDDERDNDLDHVMIVVEKSSGGLWSTVKYDAHTNDRWHYRVSDISNYKNKAFYVLRPGSKC